jgi:hypothetical protein
MKFISYLLPSHEVDGKSVDNSRGLALKQNDYRGTLPLTVSVAEEGLLLHYDPLRESPLFLHHRNVNIFQMIWWKDGIQERKEEIQRHCTCQTLHPWAEIDVNDFFRENYRARKKAKLTKITATHSTVPGEGTGQYNEANWTITSSNRRAKALVNIA